MLKLKLRCCGVKAYYASFMPDNMREELMEVARSNNFVIKYDKFDWNLHLTKACSEASRQPQRLITHHSPATRVGDPSPTTLGSNQIFTPSLHEVQTSHTDISDKVYNQVCQPLVLCLCVCIYCANTTRVSIYHDVHYFVLSQHLI